MSAAPRRVRTPTVLQMEAVECGAAALGIVLAHFRRWVPLEQLRVACGVSRDGSKASNVVKAARRFGLEAKGFKKEPGALRGLAPPMILHWNFNHFVVLEGWKREVAYLNDPASGPRTVDAEELDQAFTGVVLTFRPGPGFAPGGDPPSLFAGLRKRLRGMSKALAFALLTGLALVLPGLAAPAFFKVFIDEILLAGHREWMGPLAALMAVTALLTGALVWLQQSCLLRLETKMALAGSSRFLWHVLRLPLEFFHQRFAGDISSRVGINDQVAGLLSRDLATSVLSAVVFVFYAALMLRYDVPLTVIGLAILSLNVAALRYVQRRRVDGNRRLLQDRGKLLATAIGGLQMIETLKAMGAESDLFARWAGYQAKVVNGRQQLERYTEMLGAVPPALSALTTAIILGLGGLEVVQGRLTLGTLVAFQVLMAGLTAPVERLVGLGGQLQTVEGEMNRLDDVLRSPPDPAVAADPADTGDGRDGSDGHDGNQRQDGHDGGELLPAGWPVRLAGGLELRGITFGYSRLDPPLIERFDLVLRPGSRVALVGASGSGKSTIAKLVLGLYEPWEGEILLDGRPRREVPRLLLATSLAAVDPSIFLFAGTVRENLTLWDASVPLPEVIAAARDACVHEVIAARAGGYDSPVQADGANFSGGQRQRLEIARALVGGPSLLVLDEATSALDPTTEADIDDHLRRRGLTCLIVAHRLSTIRDADEIIVLDRGRVAERGTHSELMAAGGAYAQLISAE
jgi:NHLM bacteriocin system ABC transporter peptidase/ATP-binding protein